MMPGFLLHEGATVLCLHVGQAQPMVPNPRVTVSNPLWYYPERCADTSARKRGVSNEYRLSIPHQQSRTHCNNR